MRVRCRYEPGLVPSLPGHRALADRPRQIMRLMSRVHDSPSALTTLKQSGDLGSKWDLVKKYFKNSSPKDMFTERERVKEREREREREKERETSV